MCSIMFKEESALINHFEESVECKENTPTIECTECNKSMPGVNNFIMHSSKCLGLESDDQKGVNNSIKKEIQETPPSSNNHLRDSEEEEIIPETPPAPHTNNRLTTKRRSIFEQMKLAKRNKPNFNEIYCEACKINIQINRYKMHLRTNAHKNNAFIFLKNNIYEINMGTSVHVKQYKILSDLKNEIAVKTFLLSVTKYVKELLIERITEFDFIKFNMVLFGEYIKITSEGETVSTIKHFSTTFNSIRNLSEIDEAIDEFYLELERQASEYQEKDSGWAIEHFKYIHMTICKLESIPVGSYIALPNEINAKRATTNIKNNDVFCLKWCVLAAIAIKKDKLNDADITKLCNIKYYKINDITSTKITFRGITLDFSGISFPSQLHELRIFEKNNTNFSVNVYELIKKNNKHKVIGPARECKSVKEFHINLLTLVNGGNYHYCLIRNMQRMVKTQFTGSHIEGEFCDLCQNFYFLSSVRHKAECTRITTTYPKLGSKLSFTHYERKISPPVVVYADMESVLIPIEDTRRGQGTTVIQKHEACAVSYYVKHTYKDDYDEFYSFEGNY